MDPMEQLAEHVRSGGEEIRMVFVSSKSAAASPSIDRDGAGIGNNNNNDMRRGRWERHYVGDWFDECADEKFYRRNLLRAMQLDTVRVKAVEFVFRLKEEECAELCRCSTNEGRPLNPFERLFGFLRAAVSLIQSLERIQIYVHWTNTFRDAVYDFIHQVLVSTACRPIQHFGIVYPIADSECVERYMHGSLLYHQSLTHIHVGIMMYNEMGRIVSPVDDETIIPALPLKSCLGTILAFRQYKLRILKEGSRMPDTDDPELLVTDNLEIYVDNQRIIINEIEGYVAKSIKNMFLPYFQNACSLEIVVSYQSVKQSVTVNVMTGTRTTIHFRTGQSEGYSLLAEMCNQSQIKNLRICYDVDHQSITPGRFLFRGLKYSVSEIHIRLCNWSDTYCDSLLSYLNNYGHKELNLYLAIYTMTRDRWEYLCSELAHDKWMNSLKLRIPILTDHAAAMPTYVSGIERFLDARNKIKCLHLDLSGGNDYPTTQIYTDQFLQCINLLGNESPIEKLYCNLSRVITSQEQATQLCNILQNNYILCGDGFFFDQEVHEKKWLDLQIQSMLWLNRCGRKNILKNHEIERQDMMNYLLQPMNIPWESMPTNISAQHVDSTEVFLAALSHFQTAWDTDYAADVENQSHSEEGKFEDFFSLNCLYIQLREIPSICNIPKSKRRAKRPRIENT